MVFEESRTKQGVDIMNTSPFFVFEGIDGAGKSTQVALLAAALESRGYAVTRVRDPGGTPLSDRIRSLLLDPENPVAPAAELCLYAASRAQLVHEVIRPALEAGRVVISDRFTWSTRAYQGGGRGLDLAHIESLETAACGTITPAHVFVLDLDPAAREERMTARAGAVRDRLERENGAFFARVRQGFLDQASAHPGVGTVLDATRSPEELHAAVLTVVLGVLERANG
jgi:dTMP kinase